IGAFVTLASLRVRSAGAESEKGERRSPAQGGPITLVTMIAPFMLTGASGYITFVTPQFHVWPFALDGSLQSRKLGKVLPKVGSRERACFAFSPNR
ncbi:MAG TPA: hypothetical protein VF938_12650, partial [Candidatus Angelobacter sp.]